jgi:hypothetical protein
MNETFLLSRQALTREEVVYRFVKKPAGFNLFNDCNYK